MGEENSTPLVPEVSGGDGVPRAGASSTGTSEIKAYLPMCTK